MASVIFHSFNQIQANGFVKLFKSHKEGFEDGQQLRDFVYVKDVVNVMYWLFKPLPNRQRAEVFNQACTTWVPGRPAVLKTW